MPIAIKNSKIDISSEETTKVLAESFQNFLQGGEIIFLYGEMGVGKTTFVKYLINVIVKARLMRELVKIMILTIMFQNHFNLMNRQ